MESPEGLNIIGAGTIFSEIPPVKWLCQGLRIAPGAPTLFAGYGYSGKSAATQALCLSVASGVPLWGKFATGRGNVLHLDYEQGGRLSRERYHRLAYAEGIDVADLVASKSLELGVLPRMSLDSDLLCRIGEDRTLVNIDSWRASHPKLDENSSEVRQTLDAMGAASEKTGCVFSVLVHAKKPQKDSAGGNKFSIRGSSGFFDGAQTIIYLNGEQVGKPLLTMEKDRILGEDMDEFAIEFSDTDGRAGLLLRVADVEKKVPKAPAENYADVLKLCRELIRLKPDTNASELTELTGKRKSTVLACVQTMVASGEVIQTGTGNRVKLRMKDSVVNGHTPF